MKHARRAAVMTFPLRCGSWPFLWLIVEFPRTSGRNYKLFLEENILMAATALESYRGTCLSVLQALHLEENSIKEPHSGGGGDWRIEELCLSPVLYPWLCVLGFIIDTRRVSDTSHKEEDSRFCLTFSPRMVMTFKQEDKYCNLHILYIK